MDVIYHTNRLMIETTHFFRHRIAFDKIQYMISTVDKLAIEGTRQGDIEQPYNQQYTKWRQLKSSQ